MGASSSRVDHARLLRAFRYLAANPAQILNVTRMATELAIQPQTARGYLEALEACFLLFRVEAHRPQEHKVLTAHPRVFCADVGLAARASRVSGPDLRLDGLLLENQVAHALAASSWWGPDRIALRHWRDQRAQQEVDLLCVPSGRPIRSCRGHARLVGRARRHRGPAGLLLCQPGLPRPRRGRLLRHPRGRPDPAGMPPRSIVAVPVGRLLLGG